MNDQPKALQPPAYWYAVSVAVFIVGVVLGVWQVRRSAAGVGDDVKPVRGDGTIKLDRAGPYSVYIFRGASKRMDASADRAWSQASGAKVTVYDAGAGKQLATKNVYETIEIQNTEVGRLVEFNAPSPGTYRVSISPSLEAVSPSVRPSAPVASIGKEVMGLIGGILIGVGIGGVAALAAFVIFLVVIIRRNKFKKEMARYPRAGETY